jgi:outer membrane lipoprotein carrier protein
MKKYFLFVLGIITFLLSLMIFAVPPKVTSSNPETKILIELLAYIKTYQASFVQTVYNDKGQQIQTGHGRLSLKRPGKLRWEAEVPTQQITIINGKTLWLYDVDLAEATKQDIAETANNPASLLSHSPQTMGGHFMVTEQKSPPNRTVFTLTPRSGKDIDVVWIKLEFTGKQLEGMAFQNNLGQKSIFKFTHIQQNVRLADSLFQFQTPGGVDVIDHS